jgi:hypothetical protein
MRVVGWALTAVCLLSAGAALAQDHEIGSIDRSRPPDRPMSLAAGPGRPANTETEAWLAKDVTAADWRLISKEAAGAVFARPAGAVRPDGVVPTHLRLEYVHPFTAAKREFRSVQLDLDINCGTNQLNGAVNAFEGQNLTGRKMFFEPGEVLIGRAGGKPETENLRGIGLKLINSQIVRQQCAEGHQSLVARYGSQWRPLLSDDRGVRLVSGGETVGLDRKLELKFRIEAKESQAAPGLKWRSAIVDAKVDCADYSFNAQASLFSGADEQGETAKLAFDGTPTPLGIRTSAPGEKPAPPPKPAAGGGRAAFAAGGFGDNGPGKTVVDLLRGGDLVMGECDAARAKLAAALAQPGDPLRRQAEAWAAQSLNSKGFRLPTYVPEGVLMLSDEVIAAGDARRAVVRTELRRPVPTREGKLVASRITVIEVDCKGRRVRGVSESTFAKNGAKELVKETPAPQAIWSEFDDQPSMSPYFEAVCTTSPTS